MDWWQAAGLMGTLVLSVVGVMAFGWRMVESLRRENRKAHAEIGERITQVRTDLSGEITKVRTDLGGEIAGLRQGQTRGDSRRTRGDSRRTEGRDPLGGHAAAGLSRARPGLGRGGELSRAGPAAFTWRLPRTPLRRQPGRR